MFRVSGFGWKLWFFLVSLSFATLVDAEENAAPSHGGGNFHGERYRDEDHASLKVSEALSVPDFVLLQARDMALFFIKREGKVGLKEEIARCYSGIRSRSAMRELAECFALDVSANEIDRTAVEVLGVEPDLFLAKPMVLSRMSSASTRAGLSNAADIGLVANGWLKIMGLEWDVH